MRSIRFQFMAFIACVLLILLILLNTFPLASSRDLVIEEKKDSMSGQAAVIASSLSGLERLSQESIAEVLNLLDIRGFSRTVVTDAEGLVLYDSTGKTGAGTDMEEIITALTGKTVFRSVFSNGAFSSAYAMPVSNQGNTTGAVYLSEYDTERARIILDIQSQIRVMSITIVLLTMVLAAVFSELLLRRVHELVRSMRIVAGGDYSHRLAVRGQDELTELGNEFNLLTERLDETERQRRRFVSDASHELKTPLASIRLLSDSIVQNENVDMDTVREFVTDIGKIGRAHV